MKREKLLWKVLRAETNSPNDVFKETHVERHNNIHKEDVGKTIRRYTVPIEKICGLKDDTIYLVVQFSTDRLKFPYFVIDRKAFSIDLKKDQEFVYAINVRLCFESEFEVHHHRRIYSKGEVKENYRASIWNDAFRLIRAKPRHKIARVLENADAYVDMTKDDLMNTVLYDQFDKEERIYKGVQKKKQ